MNAFNFASPCRDVRIIREFWDRPFPTPLPSSPSTNLEGWVELIQLAATDLLRRENELIPALSRANGFSPREARRAIRGAIGNLTRHTLLSLWEDQGLHLFDLTSTRDGHHSIWPRRTVIFAGGAIPQPGIQSLVAGLMVSGRVLFRPSRQDSFLAVEFTEAMARIQNAAPHGSISSASRLGRIEETLLCATWDVAEESFTRHVIAATDSLVVFGDQPTVDRLSAMCRPEADRFVYGPRISFAVLDLTGGVSENILGRTMDDFAEDVVAFDQRGCLSPQALYILPPPGLEEGETFLELDRVSRALSRSLSVRAADGGFTPALPPAVAGEIQSLRAVYAMDPGGRRRLRASDGLPGWTVLCDAVDTSLKPLPGYQTIRLCLLPDWDGLPEILRPWSGLIQAMGVGPDTASMPEKSGRMLEDLGLSRACPLGRMQAPPLDWTHDGNPFFPVRIPPD